MHTQLESRPVDCHILAAGYTYPGGAAASWQHLRAWVRDGRWRLRTQRLCILLHQHIRLYWIPNRRCGIWCYKQRYLFVGYRIAFRIPELSRRWQCNFSGLHRQGRLLDRRNQHTHRHVQLCLRVDYVIWRDRDRLGCCARASRVSEAEDGYQGHGVHVVAIRQVGRSGGRAVRLRKTLFLD